MPTRSETLGGGDPEEVEARRQGAARELAQREAVAARGALGLQDGTEVVEPRERGSDVVEVPAEPVRFQGRRDVAQGRVERVDGQDQVPSRRRPLPITDLPASGLSTFNQHHT